MTQDKPTPQDAAQAPEARKQEAAQDVEARKQKAAQDVEARRQKAKDAAQIPEARKQRAAQDVEARRQKVKDAAQAPEAHNQKAAPRIAEKTTQPSEPQKSQPPASPVAKVIQAATQVLMSVFNVVKKPIVGSKVYTQNRARLDSGWKRVQPLVKLVQWLWKQILKPFWVRVVQPLWAKVLGLLRPRLPESLKTLSDRILTVMIVGPLVLVWWLISSLTSAAPMAQSPPTQPVVSAPNSAPAQPQKPALETPVAPKTVEPPVPVEPEEPQKVVLSVQQQVAQISDRYSTDLIPQVQADFEADRLVVQVSDRWYTLSSTEQDELGLDVLKRSDGLDFKTLEIRDSQGQLVARNPVVGPHIIVLQRRQT